LLEKKFDITYRYRRMTKKNACNCDAQKWPKLVKNV
jgi:hypothetical protein